MKLIPCSLLLLLLLSCKGVEDITFTGVDHVVLKGIENNKVNFSANIGVYNPSSLPFRITEVNLKTSVDGNYIGTLSTANPVKIKAKSDTTYSADFSLEMANLLTGASTLYNLSRKKQVNVEMTGFVKARSWLKTKKVNVAEKRLMDVPSL
jgi:LEA14-like dessication related protein